MWLVEFMYLVFTRMPGDSYCRRLRSLLWSLSDIFQALVTFLVCSSCSHASQCVIGRTENRARKSTALKQIVALGLLCWSVLPVALHAVPCTGYKVCWVPCTQCLARGIKSAECRARSHLARGIKSAEYCARRVWDSDAALCPVRTCRVTMDRSELRHSDAVLFSSRGMWNKFLPGYTMPTWRQPHQVGSSRRPAATPYLSLKIPSV